MGLERELGTIARGKRADLLLVPGDPTQDVSVLRKVRLVIGVQPFGTRPVVWDPTSKEVS